MAQIFSISFCRIGLLVLVCWLSFPPLVQAADFEITPMLQEVTLTPDETEKKIEVTVTNTTDTLGTFRLSVFDFGSLNESGGVAFLGASQDLETKYGLASWMRPEKDNVTLLPGKSETIPILIENRESLSPGGHYGALVFESVESGSMDASNAIAVKQMIASLVLVKKTGGAKPALELTGVDKTQNLFFFSQALSLRFHNPGNIHVVPRGIVTVTDPIGRLVYRGIINEASALVLPETFRLFPMSLYTIARAWIPGHYKLMVSYRFEESAEPQIWQTRFFLFPPLTSVSLIVGAGIVAGIFFWNRRKRQTTSS